MRAFPLSLLFAVTAAAPALAQDATPGPPPPVIRPDDGALTCAQMAEEAGTISKALGEEGDGPMFGRFGGVLRQGAAMLVPGAGVVIAGADALNQPEQERKLAQALNQMNRWYYLNGLYIGRGCNAPAPSTAPSMSPPVVQPPAGG